MTRGVVRDILRIWDNIVLDGTDVDVDYIYENVSCWRWTNRKYVGIIGGIRCNMTPLFTLVLMFV